MSYDFENDFAQPVEKLLNKLRLARQDEAIELPGTDSKAGFEDSTQIYAFVSWVASLSKTEYAAHEQLIAVIDKAQKLLHS
jgi:hypothetical protein